MRTDCRLSMLKSLENLQFQALAASVQLLHAVCSAEHCWQGETLKVCSKHTVAQLQDSSDKVFPLPFILNPQEETWSSSWACQEVFLSTPLRNAWDSFIDWSRYQNVGLPNFCFDLDHTRICNVLVQGCAIRAKSQISQHKSCYIQVLYTCHNKAHFHNL